MAKSRKKGEDRMSNGTGQNNKRTDRKMESNDSPEVPDRGWETSEEPGLPSGPQRGKVDELLWALFSDINPVAVIVSRSV